MLEECIRLWREVFGDSEEDILAFINNHYRVENHLFIEEDGRHVAMVHLLDFDSEIGKVGYLYALATDKNYRGRGYGKQLTMRAIELSQERGLNALFLIPAEESLKNYYAALGFKPSVHLSFNTPDNYDFGTGNVDRDVSMVWQGAGAAPALTTAPINSHHSSVCGMRIDQVDRGSRRGG